MLYTFALPIKADKVPAGPDWLHEVKYDGYRMMLIREPPKGRVRWTLRLLEEKVVELKIVDKASDNTIGRVLKKTFSNRTSESNGLSRPRRTAHS